jgi:poly(3-hydroxybutyrate) depolymerase
VRYLVVSPLLLSLASLACSSESNSGVPGSSVPSFGDGNPGSGDEGAESDRDGDETDSSNDPAGDDGSSAPSPPGTVSEGMGPVELTGAEPQSASGAGPTDASEGSEETDAETPVDETGPDEPTPVSAGCAGGAGTESNALSIALPTGNADYAVALPPGYDGQTATPLVFAFHGRGRTHLELRTVDAGNIQSEIEPQAVVVYPKSQGGNGWNAAAEVPPNVAFFEALYDRVLADYCVDTSRVFAIGHSSGGYFSNILACRFPERLRGIGSVAGQTQECSGQVAAIVIHGETDRVVPFAGGIASRDGYLQVNGCSNQSQPVAVSPCVGYAGCPDTLPVQWCQHTEPTYSDANGPTNHGWPSFASRAIGEFLFAVP